MDNYILPVKVKKEDLSYFEENDIILNKKLFDLLSYGKKAYENKMVTLEELEKLQIFFLISIKSFKSKIMSGKKIDSFNLGYQIWIYLGGRQFTGQPYNRYYLLSDEYYMNLKKKYISTGDKGYNPALDGKIDILPSKYWQEEKEPIIYLIDYLNKEHNINLKLVHQIERNPDGTPRIFENINYSWVAKFSIVN